MFYKKLHKVGNSYVVTIPKKEVERLGLEAGQLLAVHVQPASGRPALSDELREAFERSWEHNEEAYRYLAKR